MTQKININLEVTEQILKMLDFSSLGQDAYFLSKDADKKLDCESRLGSIDIYNFLLQAQPSNTTFLNNQGVNLSAIGDDEVAVKLFTQGLIVVPNDLTMLINRAISYHELARVKEGIKDITNVLSIKEVPNARNTGAILQYVAGNYDAAKQNLLACLEDPSDVDSRPLINDYLFNANYGLILSKLGDKSNAIYHLVNSLNQRPNNNHNARAHLGTIYVERGNFELALEQFQSALAELKEQPFMNRLNYRAGAKIERGLKAMGHDVTTTYERDAIAKDIYTMQQLDMMLKPIDVKR